MEAVDSVVNNKRNPVRDIWLRFKAREIGLEQMELEVKRRCIDNLHNWYAPKKVGAANLDPYIERIVTNGLMEHNKSIANWLHGLLPFAGLDPERGKILAKIDEYKKTVYNQKERLRELRYSKGSKKVVDYKAPEKKPEVKSVTFFNEPESERK